MTGIVEILGYIYTQQQSLVSFLYQWFSWWWCIWRWSNQYYIFFPAHMDMVSIRKDLMKSTFTIIFIPSNPHCSRKSDPFNTQSRTRRRKVTAPYSMNTTESLCECCLGKHPQPGQSFPILLRLALAKLARAAPFLAWLYIPNSTPNSSNPRQWKNQINCFNIFQECFQIDFQLHFNFPPARHVYSVAFPSRRNHKPAAQPPSPRPLPPLHRNATPWTRLSSSVFPDILIIQ